MAAAFGIRAVVRRSRQNCASPAAPSAGQSPRPAPRPVRARRSNCAMAARGSASFDQALEWTAEIYRAAGALMAERGLLQGVADEGGFWPAFESNEAALDALLRAIERAGFTPGQEVAISLDIASSEFCED